MGSSRKKAYRYLLYRALIEIRQSGWSDFGLWQLLNPFQWQKELEKRRYIGELADWLHNLAHYSAMDFENFDEHLFWRDFENFKSKFSNFDLNHWSEKSFNDNKV